MAEQPDTLADLLRQHAREERFQSHHHSLANGIREAARVADRLARDTQRCASVGCREMFGPGQVVIVVAGAGRFCQKHVTKLALAWPDAEGDREATVAQLPVSVEPDRLSDVG